MSWRAIARKDVSDASRSLILWIVTAVFLLFGVLVAGAFVLLANVEGPGGEPASSVNALLFIISPVALFAPIIALLVGYKAIVGERDSGSLKVLLSLPHTRWDVMVGKLVGRTVVMAVSVTLAFVVMGLIVTVFVEPIDIPAFLVVFALSILYAATFVSIAIAISGAVRSSTVAAAAMFGIFALFLMFWDLLLFGLNYLIEGSVFPDMTDIPTWYHFVDMLSPDGAYTVAVQGLLPEVDIYGGQFPEAVPLVISEWAALVVLALYLVVPFGLGYLRFRAVDL
ncbi:MAG: ABC transporter permease subunit [Halobacteriota archaeon]